MLRRFERHSGAYMQVISGRRAFILGLAGTLVSARRVAQGSSSTEVELRIDAQRLQHTLEELSTFGRPSGGSFADGVSRVAYSEADIGGRNYVLGLLRAADLEPRIDAAGNIRAIRAGSVPALKPIVFGSHIDSVPSGGNFDGDLGSLAAIEVARTLQDHSIRTRHPLEVTIWSNEEGGPVGSEIAVEGPRASDLERLFNGTPMREGLVRIGGDPTRLETARRASGSMQCYLELHIEQGGTLEKAGVPIGIVDGIVSIDEYTVEIRGVANHAGTTPMAERHNALLAAAKLIEAVQEEVTRAPGRQVGTVGQLTVTPNAPNVVPGFVRHTIEFRDLSESTLAQLGDAIRARASQIARETGTEITLKQVVHDPPALAAAGIQRQIEAAAASLGLRTMHLPSGAGHDAQFLAKIAPMGMIFVPSVGGVSHSPKEFTRWPDCANGANVLLQTILRVDAA
jgi:beta-ureidopropionase / N-carbamoyl-L-amino-acid hydrolase